MWRIVEIVLIFSILLILVKANKLEIKSHKPPRIQPRVWHGKVTANGRLGGFVVQIFYNTKLICTGTLLSGRHFISAAHCFQNLQIANFHVIAGKTMQRTEFPITHKKNSIIKLKIHPDFSKFKFIADLAVAKTKMLMKSKYIGYARICSMPLYPREKVTVAGYGWSGQQNESGHSIVLRTMKVAIVSKVECEKKLGKEMPPNVLCASGSDGQTLCTGDSGGPLIFRDEVCGISTWTWKCGETQKPDIYMSVLYYAKFIKKTIRELGD